MCALNPRANIAEICREQPVSDYDHRRRGASLSSSRYRAAEVPKAVAASSFVYSASETRRDPAYESGLVRRILQKWPSWRSGEVDQQCKLLMALSMLRRQP